MSNLTNRPVTPKGIKRTKGNKPTQAQYAKFEILRAGGCSAWHDTCFGTIDIHHALTGAGGRKDHDKVFALCTHHHTGVGGIHTIGRKKWQLLHGTEQEHLDKAERMIL